MDEEMGQGSVDVLSHWPETATRGHNTVKGTCVTRAYLFIVRPAWPSDIPLWSMFWGSLRGSLSPHGTHSLVCKSREHDCNSK